MSGIGIPVDLKRWVTDQKYNDDIHAAFMEGCGRIGQKMAQDMNDRVMSALRDAPRVVAFEALQWDCVAFYEPDWIIA